MPQYQNYYECSDCGTTWTDEWDCQCNDRCPKCNAEIEPCRSQEIGKSEQTKRIHDGAKVGLIGLTFNPDNPETPWRVQDNRKALRNEYPCPTKADVLGKIAEILDDMQQTE